MSKPITLTVDGYEAQQIQERVAELLAAQAAEKLDEMIASIARETIESKMAAYADKEARAAVEEVLAEGWSETNTYGERVGQKLTLKDRVSKHLFSARSNYDRKTRIDEFFDDTIAKAMREELGAVIKDATTKFRAQVDGVMTAKLAETLRKSLGLT